MDKAIVIFIIVIVAVAITGAIIQYREKRKVRKGIQRILRWFDFIVRHPHKYDIEKICELGDRVDEYLVETGVGSKVMYFSPKLHEYIVGRFGKEPEETVKKAFHRLADWEADKVKLEVYWTLVRGNFAEYIALKDKGEEPDFIKVAAPISILRRYWGV